MQHFELYSTDEGSVINFSVVVLVGLIKELQHGDQSEGVAW